MQNIFKSPEYVDGNKSPLTSPTQKPSVMSQEFSDFLSDVESLVVEATTMTADDLAKAKVKLSSRINSIKHSFEDAGNNFTHKAKQGAAITNHYVHEQPWAAVAAGATIGFLFGFLSSRRS